MKTASTYTVPGGVEIAIRTEHPELMATEIVKVASGESVLTRDHQMGILQALHDALKDLAQERARRNAIQQKLSQIDGDVTDLWGQLEVLGELARKDVTVEQAENPDDVLKDWPAGGDPIDEVSDPITNVMRDAG